MTATAEAPGGRVRRAVLRAAARLRAAAPGGRRALAGAAAACLLLFAAALPLAWIDARASARAAEAADAARAVARLERAARETGGALLRGALDGAPVDTAALAAALGALRDGLADALAREAQAGRLDPSAIETLARLAADLARLGDPAASGADLADRAVADALAAQAAGLGETADALAALGRAPRTGPGAAWLAAGGLATAALAAALARRPEAATPAPGSEARDPAIDRARFLALMSHELRTPMNGVVGLIALLRDRIDGPEERRMLDEAERAGRRIAAMLEDMLAQETGDEAPGAGDQTFSVEALAESVRDLYGPAAARAGVDFRVACVGPIPPRATGDGRRLLRALSHLCGYVLDKAGAHDVSLEFEHDGAECRARLGFDFAGGAAEALRLRELVEHGAKSPDEMTEAGLGPLLAKGLLERMGGRLEVATLEGGRVLVLAAAPSGVVGESGPRVRILAQTRSLGAIGAAAACAAGVEVLAADAAPAPDVVLLEAGGPDERAALADARAAWPRAAMIALGEPDAPALFDAVIRPPLEPERVAAAVDAAWRRRDGGRTGAGGRAAAAS